MDAKNNIKALWEYLNEVFESEEIEAAAQEFDFDTTRLDPDSLAALPEGESSGVLFDLAYMAVNGLFGGDFDAWNEVLYYSLEFDEETIDFLNY